jgi:hypothetical protein
MIAMAARQLDPRPITCKAAAPFYVLPVIFLCL